VDLWVGWDEDIGHPALDRHFLQLVPYLQTSHTWKQAMRHINKYLPRPRRLILPKETDRGL
jgi:hypothetical protein